MTAVSDETAVPEMVVDRSPELARSPVARYSGIFYREFEARTGKSVRGDARSCDYTAPQDGFRPNWEILRDTVLQSIATSPGSFLATADQVKAEPPEFWQRRLAVAAWAVLERGRQVLGIAMAKPPGETDDYAFPEKACFIESVWIYPDLRGNSVGEHLVTYLIERQRLSGVQQFYLWVFDHNTPAIKLYDRMDFKRTGRPSDLVPQEIQFLRKFDSDVIDDDELAHNADNRERDLANFGITYRVLTADTAGTNLRGRVISRPGGEGGFEGKRIRISAW